MKLYSSTRGFKCQPPLKQDPSPYPRGISRVSDILSMWSDDPKENLTDWAARQDSWRHERDFFARVGTLTHEMIEDTLTPMIAAGGAPAPQIAAQRLISATAEIQPGAVKAFAQFTFWMNSLGGIRPHILEDNIVCPSLKLGGTCDFKGEIMINGVTYRAMIDWKTSSRISRKQKLQLAAYNILHKARNPDDPPFDIFGIARFPRDGKPYEIRFWDNVDDEEKAFSLLLDLRNMTSGRGAISNERNCVLHSKGK